MARSGSAAPLSASAARQLQLFSSFAPSFLHRLFRRNRHQRNVFLQNAHLFLQNAHSRKIPQNFDFNPPRTIYDDDPTWSRIGSEFLEGDR